LWSIQVGVLFGAARVNYVSGVVLGDEEELTSRNDISSRISTTSRAFSFFSSFESFGGMVGERVGWWPS
jgi:hypothetical protein